MMQQYGPSEEGRTRVRTLRVRTSAVSKKVGEGLVVAGSITPEQLEEALLVQREDPRELSKILLSLGYVAEADMVRALARRLRLEYVEITERDADREVVGLVDQRVLRKHGVMPLQLHEGRLVVGTSTPTDFYALEDLTMLSGLPVTPVVAAESQIRRLHDKVFAIDNGVAELLEEAAEEATENGQRDLELAGDAGAGNAPVVRLVSAILQQAVAEEASDVHVEPRAKELAVRMRIDGVLREAMSASRQSSRAAS
jgi:type IV pilus assembly protein PilB